MATLPDSVHQPTQGMTIDRDGLPWLFSARVDLASFLGSTLAALLFIAVGWWQGLLQSDTPEWTWVTTILLIDVAHVYATGFRVYFDPSELSRRKGLYFGVPLACFVVGFGLHVFGDRVFWRVMAYLAVFHFVRQQYGWVALYRAKANEHTRWERWLDTAAIYLATIYPLIFWHGHLPRNYVWFLPQDFLGGIPELIPMIFAPIYWGVMGAYLAKAIRCWQLGRPNPGKDIVVFTTALCWYVGIISFNSEYVFTVTNVIIHGVPYMVLAYWYWTRQPQREVHHTPWKAIGVFLGTLWLFAYVEELLWDRAVWQERGWLFGETTFATAWHAVFVPLLAVPQLTHYVLDGFIWKRRTNPDVTRMTS